MSKLNAQEQEVIDTLVNVHPSTECAGVHCTIHNPSNHTLRHLPLHWRDDRKIFERICEHGVGHPDPDTPPGVDVVHGCDGCCFRPCSVCGQRGFHKMDCENQ
jgi:hypothetical protein